MSIQSSVSKFILATTFVVSIPYMGMSAPIGERTVVIEQKRFELLSATDQQTVLDLQQRMESLLATDRSELSSQERSALRSEFKEMKSEMKSINAANGSVIYISTAGIIIIVLLLIILL